MTEDWSDQGPNWLSHFGPDNARASRMETKPQLLNNTTCDGGNDDSFPTAWTHQSQSVAKQSTQNCLVKSNQKLLMAKLTGSVQQSGQWVNGSWVMGQMDQQM